MTEFLSQLIHQIGIVKLSQRAGVCYQSVSRYANNPNLPFRPRTRRKINKALRDEGTARILLLKTEIQQIEELNRQLQD